MKERLDKTIAAFLFLALALAVCVRSFSDPSALEARGRSERLALPKKSGPVGVDLLAVHGSYRAGDRVRSAFRSEDRPGVLARPLVETHWEDEDAVSLETSQPEQIPQLLVSLVMTTAAVSRAIVDGKVVGIGSQTRAGLVRAIESDAIEVLWGEHVLRFALQQADPILLDGRPIMITPNETRR